VVEVEDGAEAGVGDCTGSEEGPVVLHIHHRVPLVGPLVSHIHHQ